MPPAESGKKKGLLWIAIGAVVALAIGAGVFVALSGDDDPKTTDNTQAPDDTEPIVTIAPITIPEVATTPAPETTVVATTAVPLTLPATVVPDSTIAEDTLPPVDADSVDLGKGVSFAIPDGYTATPSDSGTSFSLENGVVTAFFQVLERTPGESPVDLMQEYVDTFDDKFDSVAYTQLIPADPTTVGTATADSNFLFYRALNADGTGVAGVIDANRRADGLAYISDIYTSIDDKTDEVFPNDSINELFNSYLDAPVIGDTVELQPLSFARVTSVHQNFVVDGLVALTPPAGWTVDAPGPGRVIFSRPDGQRFLAEKIANVADMTSARTAAQAFVTGLVPDATFGEFGLNTDQDVNFTSSQWGGTDPNTGQPLVGFISLWFDINTGETFVSLEAWIGPSTDPPSSLESDFLFRSLDQSVSKRRA